MIGGNMTDHRHVETVETNVSIIIMKVRNSSLLALLTSVFAYIMARCRPRNQSQIYGDFKRFQLPRGVHSHIVHTGYMSQGVKGGYFSSYAHKLIYEVLCSNFFQAQIFSVILFCFYFFGGEKMYVKVRIKIRCF